MQDALTLERRHLIVRQARTLGGSRPDLRRPAPVPPVHLGGPAAHGPAHQRVTPARHRRGQRARGPIGELGREYHWREERGGGQVGDAEAVADQIAGGPKLGLETVERREHLLATPRRAAGVDLHVGLHHHSEGGEEGAVEALRDRPVPQREGGSRELGLRQERAAHVRDALPVERPARLLVVVREAELQEDAPVPTLLALGQVVDAAARKPSWRHDSRAQRAVGRASAIGGQGTANSSRVSLQYARVRPSGVLQSESLSMSVRNCACSDPTTLPSRSYKTIGAVPTTPIVPSTYAMGGNPVAVAWSGIPTKQDVPGSATPRKVSTPVHPSPPPSSPVAVNSIGSVDGKSVTPGLNVITPVGASGVPPHVHTRVPRSGAARLAVACTSASATTAIAMLWSPARMISSL